MAVERIQPDGLSRPPTYSQVVKAGNTIYITDPRYREALRDVRSTYLGSTALPTSTLVVVAGLALSEYLLEIEAVAVVE